MVGAGHHSGMAGAKAGVSAWQVVSWFAVVTLYHVLRPKSSSVVYATKGKPGD